MNQYHNIQTRSDLFILKYIFPGGYLPTIGHLLGYINATGALEVTSAESNGSHYARTVDAWKQNFLQNWAAIRANYHEKNSDCTDFEVEAFRRKWLVCVRTPSRQVDLTDRVQYYFSIAAASFRLRLTNNFTITAARTPGSDVTYETLPYV